MGQPDLATKGLISYADVAADIVNVFVYNGEQIENETDLSPYITSENVVATDGKLKGMNRDNCLENIRDGMRYAIFGFENQNDIDYTMPLRIMGYDYSVYARQVEEIVAENAKKGVKSYPSRILKNQKIKPVITFVLLYKDSDEMPEDLYQMIDIPQEPQIQSYVKNYETNLINLRNLTKEQVESFRSDLGCIAKYMNRYYNKKQLIRELQSERMILTHPKDTLYTLAVLTEDNRYLAVGNNIKEGTSKMCEIADALEKIGYDKGVNVGYDKGMNAGMETGEYKKLISLVCRKLEKGYSVAEIADMLEEETAVIRKIYDVAVCYAPDYKAEKILEELLK